VQPKYDLHLSAYAISQDTVREVESLGFRRDEFANNRRCDTTAYHGTYRGSETLPSDSLWARIKDTLGADNSFVGGLEEEEFFPQQTRFLKTSSCDAPVVRRQLLISEVPRAGNYKACDIHINVSISETSKEALEAIEAIGLASFDKPAANGIVHRVFSATCETLDDGNALFDALLEWLNSLPELSAKVKFESTRRFMRLPADAPALPLVSHQNLQLWLEDDRNT
jgi:hypothetical protein